MSVSHVLNTGIGAVNLHCDVRENTLVWRIETPEWVANAGRDA